MTTCANCHAAMRPEASPFSLCCDCVPFVRGQLDGVDRDRYSKTHRDPSWHRRHPEWSAWRVSYERGLVVGAQSMRASVVIAATRLGLLSDVNTTSQQNKGALTSIHVKNAKDRRSDDSGVAIA